jgi:hypothetical protein
VLNVSKVLPGGLLIDNELVLWASMVAIGIANLAVCVHSDAQVLTWRPKCRLP